MIYYRYPRRAVFANNSGSGSSTLFINCNLIINVHFIRVELFRSIALLQSLNGLPLLFSLRNILLILRTYRCILKRMNDILQQFSYWLLTCNFADSQTGYFHLQSTPYTTRSEIYSQFLEPQRQYYC